jgi:hypothetical protein
MARLTRKRHPAAETGFSVVLLSQRREHKKIRIIVIKPPPTRWRTMP